jgi:hypothetical protein
MNTTKSKLIKIILLVTAVYLVFRVVTSGYTNVEGFTTINMDNLNQPKSNQVIISRIKHNAEDNSYEILLDKQYSIHYIHLVTNVLNNELKYTAYFKGEDGNYNENFVFQNDNLEHSNRAHNNSGNLVINNPKVSKINRPRTQGLKIKLLDGQKFNIKKVNIFGFPDGFIMTPEIIQQKTTGQTPIASHERTTDPNSGEILYKLKLNSPKKNIYGISFNYSLETSNSLTNQNNIFKVQVHYDYTDSNKTSTYKLNQKIPTSDYHNVDGVYSTNIYLERPIDANTVYLSVPKHAVINGNDHRISNLSNFKLLVGKQQDEFKNVDQQSSNSSNNSNNSNSSNSSNNRKKEEFQSVEYSADDLCPSLGGIENQMKLADSICERIEYNDKIKNERLKLERNKQYIMKLKGQDEEIEKLEKLIKSLQGKRGKRDAYNDALRLAQLQEQKKKASLVKKLVDKRVRNKDKNQLQVELNLVDEPTF